MSTVSIILKLVNPRIRSLRTKRSRSSRARALDRSRVVYSSLPEPSRQKSLWHVVILANRSAGVGIVLTQLLERSHPVVVVVVVVVIAPFLAVLTARAHEKEQESHRRRRRRREE